jgi:O-antigen ligase
MNSNLENIRLRIFNQLHYLVLLFVLVAPIKPLLGKKVIIVTFILWIVSINYKDLIFTFRNSKTVQFIFLFCFYITLSLLWTENVQVGLKWLEVNIIYFFIPIVLIITIKKELLINKMIVVFIISMMINEVISYGIFFNLIDNIFGFYVTGDTSNPIPFQVSHIPYSTYVAFTILLSLYKILFIKGKSFYVNLITIIFVITMILNLFLSTGRTGQFTIVMTIFSLLIVYQRTNVRNILISLILMIFIILVEYNIGNSFQKRVIEGVNDITKIYQNNDFNSSIGVRFGSYILLPKFLNDTNIIIGTGIGDIQDFVIERTKNYFGQNSIFSEQKGILHSTILEILITYGITGFLIFILIFYSLFKIKLYKKELIYIRYILVFFIIYSGMSANMFTFKEFMFLYAIFISVIIKEELENKQKIKDTSSNTS